MTPRDEAILHALTHKVRFFSLDQIVRTWWPQARSGEKIAMRRLGALVARGWLIKRKMRIHPEIKFTEPLAAWSPGEQAPPFNKIVYQLRSRWRQPSVATTIFLATKRAGNVFGGMTGDLKRPTQVNHDLHVSTVYLNLLSTHPQWAKGWISEDLFAYERKGEKLPDALIQSEGGGYQCAIEIAGEYDLKHLKRIHQDCVERGLPYQLW